MHPNKCIQVRGAIQKLNPKCKQDNSTYKTRNYLGGMILNKKIEKKTTTTSDRQRSSSALYPFKIYTDNQFYM